MKQRVRVLEDLPELDLVGRKLGPLKAGEEVQLRPWEAAVFERHEIVEPPEKFTVVGIRKLILAEEKSTSLQELPEGFYFGVFLRIKNLRIDDAQDELIKLKEAVSALLDIRVQKLARFAMSSVVPQGIPPEEQYLVKRFLGIIEDWKRKFVPKLKELLEEGVAHEKEFGRSV